MKTGNRTTQELLDHYWELFRSRNIKEGIPESAEMEYKNVFLMGISAALSILTIKNLNPSETKKIIKILYDETEKALMDNLRFRVFLEKSKIPESSIH
jgi:hypothetical protein